MTDAIRKRHEARKRFDAALATWRALDPPKPWLPIPCVGCRHWGGEPDSAKLGSCHVAGSFRAPGGLFTEADFGCIHGTKP